jgi:hypothetical protein
MYILSIGEQSPSISTFEKQVRRIIIKHIGGEITKGITSQGRESNPPGLTAHPPKQGGKKEVSLEMLFRQSYHIA